MSWTDSAGILNLDAGTTDELANATAISYVTALSAAHRCYRVDGEININGSSALWEQTNSIVIVHFGGEFINFSDNTGRMRMGQAVLTDEDKPIITDGCWFLHDQEANSNAAAEYVMLGSSTVAENGNIDFFGGVAESWPCNNTGAGGGGFWCFKDDEVNCIGCNFTRYGGGRFFGTNFRIQECKFMGSGRLGFSVLDTQDSVGIRDVILQDMVQGYYLSGFQSADTVYTNVALRNAPANLGASDQSDYSGDAFNCDPISSLFGTTDFLNADDYFNEYTTYDLTVLAGGDQPLATGAPDEGDALDDCEVRVVRTESTGEDNDTWARDNVQIVQANTDASGQIAQQNLITRRYNDADATIAAAKDYRGYYTSMRQYGFIPTSLPRFPVAGAGLALVDTFLLTVNRFVATTEATVAALTGIAMNEGTSEIEVTSAHTLQEVYDWLQWHVAQPAQADFAATGDQWFMNGDISPLNTADGKLFVISTGWALSSGSLANIDIEDFVLEEANGDRTAPIVIRSMVPGSSFRVVRNSDSVVLYSGIAPDDGLGDFRTTRAVTVSTSIECTLSVRLQGYLPVDLNVTITGNGLDVSANQLLDPNYKVTRGALTQTHYRWRNDNGTETTATWKQNEDTAHTGQATQQNVRLRVQMQGNTKTIKELKPKLQFRVVGDPFWQDVGDA